MSIKECHGLFHRGRERGWIKKDLYQSKKIQYDGFENLMVKSYIGLKEGVMIYGFDLGLDLVKTESIEIVTSIMRHV
jgi:hypothetical protein